MRQLFKQNKFSVYADCEGALPAIDIYKQVKSGDIELSSTKTIIKEGKSVMASASVPLDFQTWLPFAAKIYNISPDPKDYILQPYITIPADIPNRNGVAFPLKELLKFSPELGMQAYKSFKGMPVHYEHKNDVPTEAYGVIVDAHLKPMAGFGNGRVWKLIELLAIDRTKHPDIAARVLSGDLNSSSMGAWVDNYSCSYCKKPMGQCNHINKNQPLDFYELNGKLVFRNVHGVKGFETSLVETPAYVSAISDTMMHL